MATLDANHVGGGASIWVLDGVKPELWVDGGGHRDVFALMEAHLTPLWDKGNTKLPWDKGNASLPADCCRFGLTASCAAGPGSPPQDPHHVGASGSHLAAMLTARQRRAGERRRRTPQPPPLTSSTFRPPPPLTPCPLLPSSPLSGRTPPSPRSTGRPSSPPTSTPPSAGRRRWRPTAGTS